MINKNLQATNTRNEFYRDGWRVMIGVLPIMTLLLVALTAMVGWLITHEPEPRYFAVEEGRLIPMVPVNRPFVKPGDLNQWVARAVSESYMLDFQNYRTRIEEVAQYYTPEGYEAYKNSLSSSGRLRMIIDGWFVGSAVPTGVPVVVREGVINGRYTWQIRMPIRVEYISKTHRVPPQNLILTITVTRVQSYENPYGIGITQIIEHPA